MMKEVTSRTVLLSLAIAMLLVVSVRADVLVDGGK